MVSARTYPLWQELAMSDALPLEALPTVVEALCAPAYAPYRIDDREEQWRTKALSEAMPVLLARVTDTGLRARLLKQADLKQLEQLAAEGTVTAADVSEILKHHQIQPGLIVGLAQHPDQVEAAVALLPLLHTSELESVFNDWNPHRYRPDAAAPPAMPQPLFDALLERSLVPLADLLAHPEQHEGWSAFSDFSMGWSHEFSGSAWSILEKCHDRWGALVQHPVLGAAVQHLLLDHAESAAKAARHTASAGAHLSEDESPTDDQEPAPALGDDLLIACLPALCLPELAGLSKPSITARHRLHHIAGRVRSNPRLSELAADQLHAAADACVRRGRLLTPPRKDDYKYRPFALAEDLALIGANPKQLTKACALLAATRQPTLVAALPVPRPTWSTRTAEDDRPHRLLERNQQHRRAEALTALAGNPYTPRTAVTDLLAVLHPAELAWITHRSDAAEWLREAAAALTPEEEDDGVLRLLTDDELDRVPDPAAVLQSWLDAPVATGLWSRDDVVRTVLASRHCTDEHLRQLPADEVLTRTVPDIALPILLAHCGTDPGRWAALLSALTFRYDEKISLGDLLDSLTKTPATTAQTT